MWFRELIDGVGIETVLDLRQQSCIYCSMKTTIDVPDGLLREAKVEAALRGKKLRELVIEGLRRVLSDPEEGGAGIPSAFELMEDGCGIVSSGVGDLSSNPRHLEGFGND